MPTGLRRPSPAMGVALLALVASTTGVGIAATQIDGRDLKDRSIATPKLQIGSVRAAQLGTGAVTTTKLKAHAVTAGKLASGSVGTAALATGGVRGDDLSPGSVGSAQIADGAVLGAELGAGAVSEPKIANGAVSRAKLSADAALPLVAVRRSVDVVISGGTTGNVTATCAPGERLTGGGGAPSSGAVVPGVAIGGVPSPNQEGAVPTSWVAMVQNTTMGDVAVTAFAVCARGA